MQQGYMWSLFFSEENKYADGINSKNKYEKWKKKLKENRTASTLTATLC